MGLLENKNILIVGASGGIGAACARKCLEEGAHVWGTYRTKSEKLQELQNEFPNSFQIAVLDLAELENIAQTVKQMVREMKTIDVLINAAGITYPELAFSAKKENWEKVISCNLLGSFYTMQSVLVPMISKKRGSIINISSVFGLKGGIGQSSYCASKAGIIGMSKAVAAEVVSKNIRVNIVAPGYIETAMIKDMDEKRRQENLEKIPMRRFGEPEEVADLCVFLASDKSAYITGQTFVIDGGLTI